MDDTCYSPGKPQKSPPDNPLKWLAEAEEEIDRLHQRAMKPRKSRIALITGIIVLLCSLCTFAVYFMFN